MPQWSVAFGTLFLLSALSSLYLPVKNRDKSGAERAERTQGKRRNDLSRAHGLRLTAFDNKREAAEIQRRLVLATAEQTNLRCTAAEHNKRTVHEGNAY